MRFTNYLLGAALSLALPKLGASPVVRPDSELTLDTNDEAARAKAVGAKWREISQLHRKDPRAAVREERKLVAELVDKFPSWTHTITALEGYFLRLSAIDLTELESAARTFAAHPQPKVRAAAECWVRILDLRAAPMEMRFQAVDGREVDLAELRGKVVVVEFTGVTWCPACRVAEAELKELHEKYANRGLAIVAVTFESGAAKRDEVARLIKERQLPWPFSFDGLAHESPLIKPYGIRGYPTSIVLDRSGRMAAFNPKHEAMEREILRLLES